MIDLDTAASAGRQPALNVDTVTKLIEQQDRTRRSLAEISQQIETLSRAIQRAEEKSQENERLKAQIQYLQGQLSREIARAAQQATNAQSADSEEIRRLQNAMDLLQAELESTAMQKTQLQEQLEFEQKLREETETRLKTEVDSWFGEAAELSDRLGESSAKVDLLETELEIVNQRNTELEEDLSRTKIALEEARSLFRTIPVPSAPASVPQNGPVAEPLPTPPSNATLVLPDGFLEEMRSIDDHVQELKQLVSGLTERQERVEGEVISLKQLVPGAEARAIQAEEGIGRETPEDTTSDVRAEAVEHPDQSIGNSEASAEVPESGATDSEEPVDEAVTEPSTDQQPKERPWQEEFDRVERAWLARRYVGDAHEGRSFLGVVSMLKRVGAYPRSADELLEKLDSLRQRVGEHFSYCLLQRTLQTKLHRPTLEPVLVTVKMRDSISRGSYCRHVVAEEGIDGGYGQETGRK